MTTKPKRWVELSDQDDRTFFRDGDGNTVSHWEVQDKLNELEAEVERLRADAARFRWLADQNHWALFEANRPMPGVAAVTPESIDELAGEEATWLPK